MRKVSDEVAKQVGECFDVLAKDNTSGVLVRTVAFCLDMDDLDVYEVVRGNDEYEEMEHDTFGETFRRR